MFVGCVEKEINIYVGLTEMQRKWYRSVLEKDIDAVMVNIDFYIVQYPRLTCGCRSHRKEGGENSTYEYGHAGSFLPIILPRFLV